MRKLIKLNIHFVVLATIIFASCRTKFYEDPKPVASQPGVANFSKYVAVGTSITAGFMDGALYTEGQENSYPNLIAGKIKEVKSDLLFVQPDINSVNGFVSGSAGPILGRLNFVVPANCPSQNFIRKNTPGEPISTYTGNKLDITNLGVPYINTDQLNKAITIPAPQDTVSTKPYKFYERIVTNPGTSILSHEAGQRKGTFFTLWIGYNELRDWAAKGGADSKTNVSLLLPDASTFGNNFRQALDSLLANGATGVVANIPDVSLWPIVTNNNQRITNASDPIGVPLKSNVGTTVTNYTFTTSDTTLYNGKNNIPSGLFKPNNKNKYAIVTKDGTVRQIHETVDFVVLSRSNLDSLGFGAINYECAAGNRALLGIKKPIPNSGVLDSSEVAYLRTVVQSYNNAINAILAEKNSTGATRVGLVNLFTFYDKLAAVTRSNGGLTVKLGTSGITYGSTTIRASHLVLGPDFGGFYSLDRIHPNPKGQSLIANEFIKAINSSFGASLGLYNPDDFRGNLVP